MPKFRKMGLAKTVKVGAGFFDRTKTPYVGASVQCTARVFKDKTVWVNIDEIEKALNEYKQRGHDANHFEFILRKFKFNALDQAFPPQWMIDWMKENQIEVDKTKSQTSGENGAEKK